VVLLQTFSKIYGLAGIRVGFGISSPEIIQFMHQVKEPFNVNALAQVAATAALEDTEHITKSQKVNEEGRFYLYHQFKSLGVTYIESMSNFILVRFGKNTKTVYQELLQRGIIVRLGEVWDLPDYLRISVGTEVENKALIQALKDLKNKGLLAHSQ
jgi:histidinol-phosphate aminotransferase